ncbi:MAG: ABC transporter ATP-binding protein [Patescibacteria group bacterium]|nr:ABC transporter ATP-binding protein [Patescibacteria group bacterium]
MGTSKDLIAVKDISKTYRLGEVQVKALQNVTLAIQPGDFMVVTGRNGSGKSTLLYQLGLLDWPDSGEIFLEGQEVVKLSDKHRRELRLNKIGYIFQNYALIAELTALENVMLPAMMLAKPAVVRERARRLLKRVGLEHRLNHLIKRLSGGEQQKVAIARALINDPKIIIADEPTANLDTLAAKDVLTIFQSLNRDDGHTIVMVTHEQEETACANRLIKLSDGKIV